MGKTSKKNGFLKHKCESCGKSFCRAYVLKEQTHIVHEGRKDHKCESCSKTFTRKYVLKNHIHTVHEGHKDHNCESCGKSFSRAENLNRHIQTIQHIKRTQNHALLSEQLENIAESCSFGCENSWTKQNIKKEYTIENYSTKPIENKSETINIKEDLNSVEITNSMSKNIKTEIKEEIIEQNFNTNEESQSDLNFLCENELELDQIPIFEMTTHFKY